MSKLEYILPEHDEKYPDCAKEIDVTEISSLEDVVSIAEAAADHFSTYHDGWE